jgi:hypothetical protein
MTHFYLTLPSNSSKKFYPGNTMTKYTTRLQTALELSGDWEVALVEMMFTRTWYTIPRNSGKFTFYCGTCPQFKINSIQYDSKGAPIIVEDYIAHLTVPFGYYDSIRELVNTMNTTITESATTVLFPTIDENGERTFKQLDREDWPTIRYNEIKRKIFIELPPGTEVTFDDYLTNLLGVKSNPVVNNGKVPKLIGGNKASDIKAGIHGLYVYCDVLENVPVGDTEAPLLRVVDATGYNGENVHRIFHPLRYVPLRKKNFDSLEIDIRDDIGLPIAFESGRLFVTLHFRRAANPYFS